MCACAVRYGIVHVDPFRNVLVYGDGRELNCAEATAGAQYVAPQKSTRHPRLAKPFLDNENRNRYFHMPVDRFPLSREHHGARNGAVNTDESLGGGEG
jgi:hypothetical protein